MELNVESRITLVWLQMIVLLSSTIPVLLSQTVTVSMEPAYYSDPATASANLTCQFSVDDGTYTFFNLEWKIDGSLVADFYNGVTDPLYINYCLSSSDCAITRTSTKSDFIISSLDMTNNKQTFSCQVIFRKGVDRRNGQDTALLGVTVPTNTIVMSNGSSSEAFTDGSEVELSLDVPNHIFQCVVANINPQATFTWTVGSEQLPTDSITESHVPGGGTGLTTSTSNATLTPNPDYSGNNFTCKAVNYDGDPGVMVRLVLKVADPCDGVECKNGGTCVIDPNDPSMTECECPDGYEGNLCGTVLTTMEPSTITTTKPATPTTKPVTGGITSDTTTTPTPQETTTPTSPLQGTTMSPSAGNTESSTNIATANSSIIESTSPTTTTMTTAPGTFTTNTPYSTTSGCATLCDEELIGLSTGAKIGIGVGCACGCVIAAGCGIAIYKYNKTTEVTPEGQSKEGQSKKGQSKKGKKKDADGKTPENV